MIELCFIGTGGWIASPERDNTSFLIHHDDNFILIDCPGSVIQKIKRLNFRPSDVKSILITHIHPDHVYGLPSFVHSLMFDECQIDLYGSQKTVDFCREFLDLFHLRDKKIKTRIRFVALSPGEDFQLKGSCWCSSLETPHSLSSLAYDFHFEHEEKRVVYSGDTPLHPPFFTWSKGVDFLIHECSAPVHYFKRYPALYSLHTNSLDLGNRAQQCGVKCLIPCHFFDDKDFSISDIEDEIKINYSGRLIIPRDLEKIPLKAQP